jgi:hypothetical protein
MSPRWYERDRRDAVFLLIIGIGIFVYAACMRFAGRGDPSWFLLAGCIFVVLGVCAMFSR